MSNSKLEEALRAIAIYLPQFHPVPENDLWWGKGFTEWTNVAKCKPAFKGHYQPHLPADLGFYDLRLPEVREAQAEMARNFGISGFCYYHYWFNGRRILERPMQEVLASGKPDFPFCFCWANENWTRAWDGNEREVLLQQCYSDEDDRNHLRTLAEAFADKRYIRVDGKPLFAVYRASALPNPKRTTDIWREEAARLGIGDLFLCRVESFANERTPPLEIGFDAAIEFAPDWNCVGLPSGRNRWCRKLARINQRYRYALANRICSYQELVQNMRAKPEPGYPRFRGVTPMWDNSARRSKDALVLVGSTPEIYEEWLRAVVAETLAKPQHRLVFINAWNEWAEGNHLEPCQRWGDAYLQATRRALATAQTKAGQNQP